ncbi:hypothetical protein BDD43_4529 [Mucilaginibacter gracilis]|uniref:Uncharacterized protein n=1 Tax=Mucilaginibacter gracilis TaxID=423350 RepID=A0A495J5Z9_9SPHI|nr:hypothetical protein [Mucilaginibacter gracilis]RKR83404.1 hypothetical protein BDD43_3612 [Mucilaginibacter gracilis]RKR84297.1 hypothetical protein BDD43_4529 [Mucilaginibacter gracilis]
MIYKFKKSSQIVLILMLISALAACKKSQDFYQKLVDMPEVVNNYNKAYEVDSTMVITGRLNPEKGLKIEIGGIEAKIVSLKKVTVGGTQSDPYEGDQATITITNAMGIGENRPVKITSAGNTIDCPSIEILSPGVIAAQLKLQSHFVPQANDVVLYCLNGKGSVYVYSNASGQIVKIDKSANVQTVINTTTFSDADGPFAITGFNSGGTDPQESTLYFSALTTDGSANSTTSYIYRLCKIDLKTKTLTTLNKTLYPKSMALPVIPTALPLEGTINQVNLMDVSGIYPDSKGNVYLRLGKTIISGGYAFANNYATALLNSNGSIKYLFKTTLAPNYDSNLQTEYNASILKIPGTGIIYNQGNIMPDEQRMYCYALAPSGNINALTDILQYDLENTVTLYKYSKLSMPPTTDKPYISGVFNTLTAVCNAGSFDTPDLFGFMPLPGGRILIYYYQQRAASFSDHRFPAFGTMDFIKKRGDRYAPGAVETGSYKMFSGDSGQDQLLNYDEEGMIYSTANNKTVIVKTVKK